MRIWLIKAGEPLPIDAGRNRLLRTGLMAEIMSQGGHDVLWWTSTFDHVHKRQRAGTDHDVQVADRFRIRLLHSPGYRKNVSLARFADHRELARRFNLQSMAEQVPDVIVCSLPTPEFAVAAVDYGRRMGTPVVLDVRDLWPDVIAELAPRWAQPIARWALRPMFRTFRDRCGRATAVTGITDEFVDWACRFAGRQRTANDRAFPLAYSERRPSADEILEAKAFWEARGVSAARDEFIACFFGAFSRHFDLDTVVSAARTLEARNRSVKFVLCGQGPAFRDWQHRAAACRNVVFPGWVNAAEIWTLMRMSAVGLAPYVNSRNFTTNLPNKPVEYLSAGLPVISGVRGVLSDLLAETGAGRTYESGNCDQLATILEEFDDNRTLLQATSSRALSLFRERFVAENVYAEYQSYLERIASSHVRARAA